MWTVMLIFGLAIAFAPAGETLFRSFRSANAAQPHENCKQHLNEVDEELRKIMLSSDLEIVKIRAATARLRIVLYTTCIDSIP